MKKQSLQEQCCAIKHKMNNLLLCNNHCFLECMFLLTMHNISNIGAIAACFCLAIIKAEVHQALKSISDEYKELFHIKLKKAMEVVVSAAK